MLLFGVVQVSPEARFDRPIEPPLASVDAASVADTNDPEGAEQVAHEVDRVVLEDEPVGESAEAPRHRRQIGATTGLGSTAGQIKSHSAVPGPAHADSRGPSRNAGVRSYPGDIMPPAASMGPVQVNMDMQSELMLRLSVELPGPLTGSVGLGVGGPEAAHVLGQQEAAGRAQVRVGGSF